MLDQDRAFLLLKRRIFLDRGLDCEQYKENYLKRRIAVRQRATGAQDYLEYLRVLRNDEREYANLLNELTINVTQFFRDKDVYRRIRDEVTPSMVEAKGGVGSRTLRIWSAGCATGEEPYSIAMVLDVVLGSQAERWNVRIHGSDIDDASLRVAKAGVYPEPDMLEGVDRDRYFERVGEGDDRRYRISEAIRKKVKFEKMDLLKEQGRRYFDMILCRNVLIYFSRGVQTKIISALANSITREGYLILGKSETLGQDAGTRFKPVFPRERIYQVATGEAKAMKRAEGSG